MGEQQRAAGCSAAAASHSIGMNVSGLEEGLAQQQEQGSMSQQVLQLLFEMVLMRGSGAAVLGVGLLILLSWVAVSAYMLGAATGLKLAMGSHGGQQLSAQAQGAGKKLPPGSAEYQGSTLSAESCADSASALSTPGEGR